MSTFTEIIDNYVKNYKKITLNEFIEKIKNKLYPNKDMRFMEYFMELADEVNDGKFIVPHQKLIEYGVINIETKDSGKIKQKLETLDLISDKHYLFTNISEKVNNVGTKPRKQYTLTPEAFKLCLLRAKKSNKDGAVDPKIYAEYYMFIEKCILYYNKYEKQLAEAFSKIKDNKIQEQSNKIDELIIEVKDIKSINLKQSAELSKQSEEINKLLNYGKTANENIEEMQTSIDDMTNTVASALRDRNVRPDDDKHVQRFMLVKLNKYEYKIHTGTISHLRNVINNYTKDKKAEPKKYRNTKIIIQPIYNPNPSSLKKRLFKKINDYIKNELILLNTNIEPSVLYENVFTNRSNIIIDDDYYFNLHKLLTIIIEAHNNRLDDDILDLSLNDNNDIDYNYQIKTYTI